LSGDVLTESEGNGVLRFARYVTSQAKGRPGRLSNILWHVTSYFVSNISAGISWIFFRVLNRTTYIGRHHIGREPNTLLLSNHQSMIDSMPIALAAFYPKSWLRPYLVPWHPAARENFFKNKFIAWYSSNTRCIPVKPGRRDVHALHKMIDVLPKGAIILFPEGTRSRTGDVGDGRPGAGLVAPSRWPSMACRRFSPSVRRFRASGSASTSSAARRWTTRSSTECHARERRPRRWWTK